MSTLLLFTSFFLRDPLVLITFGFFTIAGTACLIPWIRRRRRNAVLLAIAAAASAALIISFTWLPGGGGLAALNPSLWDPSRIPLELGGSADFGAWLHGTDDPLNVLLYVPAGVTLAALTTRLRSAIAVAPCLAAFSLITEIWQALTGTRSGQLSDVIANTLGAVAGVTATILIRALLRRTSPRHKPVAENAA